MILFINKLSYGKYRKVDKVSKKASFQLNTIEETKNANMKYFGNLFADMYNGIPIAFSLDDKNWIEVSKKSNPELFI